MQDTVVVRDTIDLNAVAAFVRVVEAGSFTGAARLLGVPKSAVSRRVARLEDQLGARLLQRTTRRLHLTEAGTRYHQQAANAMAALGEAASAVGVLQGEPAGTVRVTAPPDIGHSHLAAIVAAFAARHPKVRVELVLTGRVADLVAEGIDFAVRAGNQKDSSLIARRIAQPALVLAASPAYLERRGTPQSPDELANHDFVLFRPERGRNRWPLFGPDGERTLTVTGPVGVDDMAFVHQMVLHGTGIGMLPHQLLLAGDAKSAPVGQLVRVLPAWRGPAAPLSLVYPPARHVPQRVLLLREMVFERLKKVFDACAEAAPRS